MIITRQYLRNELKCSEILLSSMQSDKDKLENRIIHIDRHITELEIEKVNAEDELEGLEYDIADLEDSIKEIVLQIDNFYVDKSEEPITVLDGQLSFLN